MTTLSSRRPPSSPAGAPRPSPGPSIAIDRPAYHGGRRCRKVVCSAHCAPCSACEACATGAAMPPRRFLLVVSAIGALVGLAVTYPLARHPVSTVLDDGTLDAFQFVWNIWWVREALLHLHTNPFHTRYLFYP